MKLKENNVMLASLLWILVVVVMLDNSPFDYGPVNIIANVSVDEPQDKKEIV